MDSGGPAIIEAMRSSGDGRRLTLLPLLLLLLLPLLPHQLVDCLSSQKWVLKEYKNGRFDASLKPILLPGFGEETDFFFSTLYEPDQQLTVHREDSTRTCYLIGGLRDERPSLLYPITGYMSNVQVRKMAGDVTADFCAGCRAVMARSKRTTDERKDMVRRRRNTGNGYAYQPRGRYRGQTQSQYLNFGSNGSAPGKAEAESSRDGSRAAVSGTSGMGQAQSQSFGSNCEDCYDSQRSQNQAMSLHGGRFGTGAGLYPAGDGGSNLYPGTAGKANIPVPLYQSKQPVGNGFIAGPPIEQTHGGKIRPDSTYGRQPGGTNGGYPDGRVGQTGGQPVGQGYPTGQSTWSQQGTGRTPQQSINNVPIGTTSDSQGRPLYPDQTSTGQYPVNGKTQQNYPQGQGITSIPSQLSHPSSKSENGLISGPPRTQFQPVQPQTNQFTGSFQTDQTNQIPYGQQPTGQQQSEKYYPGQVQPGYGQLQPGYDQYQTGQVQTQPGRSQSQPGQGQLQSGQDRFQPGQGQQQPIQSQLQPGHDQYQTGQGQTQPGHRQSQLGQGQLQSGQDRFQPGQGQQQPIQNQLQPGHDQYQTGQVQTQPGHSQSQLGQGQLQSGQDRFQPGQGQQQPIQNQLQPGHDQYQTGQVQTQPGHSQSQPGQGQLQSGQDRFHPGQGQTTGQGQFQPSQIQTPGHSQFQPGQGQQQPIQSQLQPGHVQLPPGQEQFQPGFNQLRPGQQQFQPGHGQYQPSQGQLQHGRDQLQPIYHQKQPGQDQYQHGQEQPQSGWGQLQHGQGKFQPGQNQYQLGHGQFQPGQGQAPGQSQFQPSQIQTPGHSQYQPGHGQTTGQGQFQPSQIQTPGHSQFQPGQGQQQPIQSQLQPGHVQLPPGQEQFQPGFNQLRPGQQQFQPGHGQYQPSQGQLQHGRDQLQPIYHQKQPGQDQYQHGQEQPQSGWGQLQHGQGKFQPGQNQYQLGHGQFQPGQGQTPGQTPGQSQFQPSQIQTPGHSQYQPGHGQTTGQGQFQPSQIQTPGHSQFQPGEGQFQTGQKPLHPGQHGYIPTQFGQDQTGNLQPPHGQLQPGALLSYPPGHNIYSAPSQQSQWPGREDYDGFPQTQVIQQGDTTVNGVSHGDGPGSVIGDDNSQALASIQHVQNETQASASSMGRQADGVAQTQISGTYSGSGSFSAQAQTTDAKRGAQSQITVGKMGAMSSAQGNSGFGQSQALLQLGTDSGATKAEALSGGWNHGTNTQVQTSEKGGMADAQANGPGSTSSQAQIGFQPYQENSKDETENGPFRGGGTASAQSGKYAGQSQTQIQGKFKYGISYNGAAQAETGSRDASFNRTAFVPLDVFNRNSQRSDREANNFFQSSVTENSKNGHKAILEENMSESESKRSTQKVSVQNHSNANSSNSAMSSRQSSIKSDNEDFDDKGSKDLHSSDDYEDGDDDNDYESDFNSSTDVANQKVQYPYHQKEVVVQQMGRGQKQHIILGSLDNNGAHVIQDSANNELKEGMIFQPGDVIPGTQGYTIPIGFRGRVSSVAHGNETYSFANEHGESQAQTVTLTPGSRNITHSKSPIKTQSLRSWNAGNKGYNSDTPLNKFNLRNSPENYVTVTKSVTGAFNTDKDNPNEDKKFSHTYYTKSSTCGYFTFSCNIVFGSNGRTKICRPKNPINPDGTPVQC